jgi:hypothetical protein
MQLTPKQLKKLQKIEKMTEDELSSKLAIIDSFEEVEEKVEEISDSLNSFKDDITSKLDKVNDNLKKKLEEELVYEVDESKIVESVISQIPVPKDGEDYVLTDKDKKDIAKSIEVPIVEKVIVENTIVDFDYEKVKEYIPLVPNFTDIRNAFEVFPDEEKLKTSAIYKLDETLEKFREDIANSYSRVVSNNRNLYNLLDVNLSGLTVDQSIKWDGTQWIPYTPSSGGGVQSIVAGANITVDNTDPANPIVSSTGGDILNLQEVTDEGATTTNTTTFSPSGNNKAIVANGSGSGIGIDITHAGSGTKLKIGTAGSGDLIDAGDFNVDNAGNVVGNSLELSTMTPGSVGFFGASGLLSQNNQNFFWNTNPEYNNNTLNISGALGAEQLSNPGFTGGSSPWTLNAGWVYASNAVSKTSNGTGALTQTISTMVNGTIGIVSITVSALTVGSVTVSVGGTLVGTISANGTYTYRFISTTISTAILITPSNTARLTVDNVSVKYLTGGGLVVAGTSFFRSKMIIAQNNTSTTLGTTSDHLELINTTTSGVTNFNFKFAQTALSGIQARSTGTLDFIATNTSASGGFTWKLGSSVASLSDAGNLDTNGWSTSASGRFGTKVVAGVNSITAPATLNNNGSYAGRGVLITTTGITLATTYEFVYLDSSLTAGCTGTTAVDCSAQTDSASCSSYSALGCINNFGNCIDLPDEESCNGTSPCSWVTTADCSDFNNDEGACSSTSGCTANYEGDCSAFNNDETACTSAGCSWSDPDCSGSYYTGCSGSYDVTPYCSGGEFGSCNGTASCANITDEGTCDGTSPCVWGEQQVVKLPNVATALQNNMSLKYAIKKTGGTGDSIVQAFDSNSTIEGLSEKTFSTVGDSMVIHFFNKVIPCSSYGNESACNAIDGCFWDTEDPENPFCNGSPTAKPSWNIIADKV